VADKFREEEKQVQATTSTGLPKIGKPMEKHAVRKKKIEIVFCFLRGIVFS
jgi:hypothetical protein